MHISDTALSPILEWPLCRLLPIREGLPAEGESTGSPGKRNRKPARAPWSALGDDAGNVRRRRLAVNAERQLAERRGERVPHAGSWSGRPAGFGAERGLPVRPRLLGIELLQHHVRGNE